LLLKLGVDPHLAQNSFEYYDVNAGFSCHFDTGTKLSVHYYKGQDMIQVQELSQFSFEGNASRWGNHVLGIQLSHVFSNRFSMLHHLDFSRFDLNSRMNWLANDYQINTDKKTYNYKADFIYLAGSHHLKTGLETSFQKQLPVTIRTETNDGLQTNFRYNRFISGAVYVRDEWEAGPLLLNVGIRTSLYHKLLTHHSSEDFGLSEIDAAKTFIRLEPRLSGRWMLNDESSVKLSAGKHNQYTNRVQLINFGLPMEIFVASSSFIQPSSLWHFSGGYFRSMQNNHWEISAEAYYKSFSNLLEFGGTLNDLFSVTAIEQLMYAGRGYAYGTELMIRKNFGKIAGWINYTLGWNYRQFDDINAGNRFLASNDRRHDLSIIAMYNITPRLNLNATFVYATGNRLNLPRSWYIIDDKVVLEFTGHNAFKMPDYHRLDVSLTYKLPQWQNIHSKLNLSVYNLYNRANPFEVHYSTKAGENNYDYKIAMSYLTPILPAVSWTFHLK